MKQIVIFEQLFLITILRVLSFLKNLLILIALHMLLAYLWNFASHINIKIVIYLQQLSKIGLLLKIKI